MPEFKLPEVFKINDNMVVPPVPESEMDSVEILRGPNIKPFPETSPLDDSISAPVSLKVGDNITTDHIMPAGARYCRSGQIFRLSPSIALQYATKNSRQEQRKWVKALLSAAQTTDKARRENMRSGSPLSRNQGRIG